MYFIYYDQPTLLQEKKRRALELTSFAEAASIQPGRKTVCIHFGAEGCIHISSLPPPPEG